MKKKILLLVGCLSFIALGIGLFFNHFDDHRQIKVDDYLVTFYSIPRELQIGEMQIAVRIQDEHYHIVTEAEVVGYLRQENTTPNNPIKLEPGSGRDFRGWLTIEQAGPFVIDFQINHNQKKTVVSFPIVVASSK